MLCRNFLIIAFLMVSTTSCVTYQVDTVQTNDQRLKETEDKSYIFENDSVKVTYVFENKQNTGLPVNLSIYNKLSVPLYIDWSKSGISLNGKSISMLRNEVSAVSNYYSVTWNDEFLRNISTTRGTAVTNIKLPESVSFIMPQSTIEAKPVTIKPDVVKLTSSDSNTSSFLLPINYSGEKTNALKITYAEKDTPYKIVSLLSFTTNLNESSSNMIVSNNFFVGEILQMSADPNNTALMLESSVKNRFITSKTN